MTTTIREVTILSLSDSDSFSDQLRRAKLRQTHCVPSNTKKMVLAANVSSLDMFAVFLSQTDG